MGNFKSDCCAKRQSSFARITLLHLKNTSRALYKKLHANTSVLRARMLVYYQFSCGGSSLVVGMACDSCNSFRIFGVCSCWDSVTCLHPATKEIENLKYKF